MEKTFIAKSGKKGRGVFALKAIKKGEVVIQNHVAILPGKEYQVINKTIISDYYFAWGNVSFIVFGNASLLNHDSLPNLDWSFDRKKLLVTFRAKSDIKKDEELTFDYGWSSYPWKNKLLSKKQKVKSSATAHTTQKKSVPKKRK